MHMHIGAGKEHVIPRAKEEPRDRPYTNMGLLNWLHDRRVVDLQNQLKLMASDIKVMQAHADLIETKFNSLNAKLSRKTAPKEEEPEEMGDLEEMIKAFGGELPIELRQKYKKP